MLIRTLFYNYRIKVVRTENFQYKQKTKVSGCIFCSNHFYIQCQTKGFSASRSMSVLDHDARIDLLDFLKMAFFQKVRFFFQVSKSPPKRYSKKSTLNLKFKIPVHNTSILNFKLRITFGILFWRLGDLKKESHFLKKTHL